MNSMWFGALVAWMGCASTAPPPSDPAKGSSSAAAAPSLASGECVSVVSGSVHDLDNSEAPLAGATVILGGSAAPPGDPDPRAVLTDPSGAFIVEYVAQPIGGLDV